MSGVTEQFPALIGVVIGPLASYLASAATERTRWRRERSSRWDDRRAQAYADYGYASKTSMSSACVLTISAGGG